MDRDYYRSLTEAYQSIYEAPLGAAANVVGPLAIKGATGTGISAAQAWPEYNRYRDEGMSHEEAVAKAASVLGISALGSTVGGSIGGALGAPTGPGAIASTAGGSIVGGQAATRLFDELYDQYNATGKYGDKRTSERQGVVWDGKKYVHKPENLTRYRGEGDEDFAKRQQEGKARAAELNAKKGGPQAPTWLKWEADKAKKEAEKQRETSSVSGGPKGWNANNDPSNGGNVTSSDTYTVSGIEYDRKTGRPVKAPPSFVPGQSRTPPASETETETETDTREISGYDKDGNKIYTDDVEQRNTESGATTSTPSGSGGNISGYTADGEPIRTQDVVDRNNQAQQKPEGMVPGKQNVDGSNVTQTGKNDKGLTPYQQWAKNFPKLAAKVKPGQAGYDDIQAMNKATPALTQDAAKAGQTGGGVVDGARRAASKVKDAAQRAGNSNAGQRVTQATDNAIRATRRAAQRAAGSQAVRTVKDQAGKGLNRLNNAVRNRTGNNNNE